VHSLTTRAAAAHDRFTAPPQAGLPQEAINEIHGSWFDPSNPVVKMSGELRSDLFEDLLRTEAESDMVLALGTSLSGARHITLVCCR
jgi:hypothetical protein